MCGGIWPSGRYIVQPPYGDSPKPTFSLSRLKRTPWVDTYWLQEICGLSRSGSLGGIIGLTLANAGVVAILVFLIGMRNPDPDISWDITLFGVVWIFLAAHPRGFGWGEKAKHCHTRISWTSFLHTALIRMVVFFSRDEDLAIFKFILWANMHRGFILGLAILGIHLLAELMKHPQQTRRIGLWGFLCAAATLINPYGHHVYGMGWQDFRLSPVNVTGWAQTPWGHLELFWITLAIFWSAVVGELLWSRQPLKALNFFDHEHNPQRL